MVQLILQVYYLYIPTTLPVPLFVSLGYISLCQCTCNKHKVAIASAVGAVLDVYEPEPFVGVDDLIVREDRVLVLVSHEADVERGATG